MASKSHRSGPDFSGIVEQWRKERNQAQRRKPDPLMERIRKRVGLLDDSVDLIREDRDR